MKTPPPNSRNGVAKAHRCAEDVLQLKDKFERIWEVSYKDARKIERSLSEVTTINFISCGG